MVTRQTQSIDSTGVAAAAHAMAVQVFYVGGIVLLAMSTVAQTLIPSVLLKNSDNDDKQNNDDDNTTDDKRRKKVNKLTGAGGALAAKATANRMMAWGFILGTFLGLFQLIVSPLIHKVTPILGKDYCHIIFFKLNLISIFRLYKMLLCALSCTRSSKNTILHRKCITKY